VANRRSSDGGLGCSSAKQEKAALAWRPKYEELVLWYLLSALGARAAHARSYLALAIAVAAWNVLGQISLVDHLGSPGAAQGPGMLAALAGDSAQCSAGQR
jgi:hypothetical protein